MKAELTDLQVQFTLSEIPVESSQASRFEISSAGMVLLHPFMKRLFRDLGLMESATFSHNAARCRGIYVWHFVASGIEDDTDINFLLPKLLCGLSPGDTFYKEAPISDFEKSICTDHLCRLLRYWDLAPDIESLRRDFLRRSGIIEKIKDLWTLGLITGNWMTGLRAVFKVRLLFCRSGRKNHLKSTGLKKLAQTAHFF